MRPSTRRAAFGIAVPGPKTAFTPACSRNAWSRDGMIPPTMTMMSRAPDREVVDVTAEGRPFLVAGELAAVDARDGADLGPVPPPDLLERLRDLAHRGARPGRVDRQLEQVPVSRLGPSGERLERGPH